MNREKRFFLSVYVDGIKLAGKNQINGSMWKVLMEENRHHSLTFFIWVTLNVNEKQTMILWRITGICSNHDVLLEQLRNCQVGGGNLDRIPFTMLEAHAKKCVERSCELPTELNSAAVQVSTPCIDDHHFKEEELGSAGDLSNVCS